MQTLPVRYGASYTSAALLAAAGVATIIAPGTNLRGLIIHAASLSSYCSGAFGSSSILAKSSAPANIADGVPVLTPDFFAWNGTAAFCGGKREQELFIPAGLGIYRFSLSAESVALASVLYTVLP